MQKLAFQKHELQEDHISNTTFSALFRVVKISLQEMLSVLSTEHFYLQQFYADGSFFIGNVNLY